MVVGEGWGGGGLFLLLVGEALSSYPTHISTFIQFFFCFPVGETSTSVNTSKIPVATDKNISTSFLFPLHTAVLF